MNHNRVFRTDPPRRDSIDAEEQRAWVAFYKRVGHDAALAAEVMAQLDGDAEMKRRHLALYLSCRQAVRTHKARQARDKRLGLWLRMLVGATLVQPFALSARSIQRALNRAGDLLTEAITPAVASDRGSAKRPARSTDAAREPASPQVSKLLKEAEFAKAHAVFEQQDTAPSAAESEQHSDLTAERAAPIAQAKRR